MRFEALCALRPGRFLSALRFSLRDTYNFDALPNETSHPGCYGVGYISAEQEYVTSAAMPHLTSANGGISRVNYKRLVTAAAELFDRLSAAWWIPALLMRLFVRCSPGSQGGPVIRPNVVTTATSDWRT